VAVIDAGMGIANARGSPATKDGIAADGPNDCSVAEGGCTMVGSVAGSCGGATGGDVCSGDCNGAVTGGGPEVMAIDAMSTWFASSAGKVKSIVTRGRLEGNVALITAAATGTLMERRALS